MIKNPKITGDYVISGLTRDPSRLDYNERLPVIYRIKCGMTLAYISIGRIEEYVSAALLSVIPGLTRDLSRLGYKGNYWLDTSVKGTNLNKTVMPCLTRHLSRLGYNERLPVRSRCQRHKSMSLIFIINTLINNYKLVALPLRMT